MRRLLAAVLAALIAAPAVPALAAGPEPAPADLREARALAQSFLKQLGGELKAAIAEGGPTHAIPVCREAAPGIAGQLSTDSGWAVGRTALKVRNPRNAPSVRERAVLMEFQRRAAAGESFARMESAAVIQEGGRRYLHYMKAIPTKQVCLACHGSNLAEPVQDAIRASYPADAATGFEQGELRGAFTFVKPLPAE